MNTNRKPKILTITQIGSSQPGPGPCQPPRKKVTATPEITNISMYSAIA